MSKGWTRLSTGDSSGLVKTPRRIAVLCQVGHSDSFFFKPRGGAEENAFTKEELELAESISSLEPYDRGSILPHVSVEAMDAIQKTASGMLGMLPPTQFQIQIQASRDPLANLVFSSLCTGYALRGAEYRLHLQDSLSEGDNEDETEISLALDEKTRSSLPGAALDYIKNIELQLQSYKDKEILQGMETESSAPGTNRLLQYVRGMDPESINKLSESASRGVVQAFNLTVKKIVENLHLTQSYPSSARLLGRLKSTLGEAEKRRISSTSGPSFTSTTFNISRDNLIDALLWSMLVGYYTKNLECRFSLEKCVHENSGDDPDRAWYLKLGSLFHDEQ
eukprot:g2167.t1